MTIVDPVHFGARVDHRTEIGSLIFAAACPVVVRLPVDGLRTLAHAIDTELRRFDQHLADEPEIVWPKHDAFLAPPTRKGLPI